MPQLQCKYEYKVEFGQPFHIWSCVGAKGGIHVWFKDYRKQEFIDDSFIGGIEIHYRSPPEDMQDDAPSHDQCWLLKCPCWHDGSSMQASERWLPLWRSDPDNHDRMFELLKSEYMERFGIERAIA